MTSEKRHILPSSICCVIILLQPLDPFDNIQPTLDIHFRYTFGKLQVYSRQIEPHQKRVEWLKQEEPILGSTEDNYVLWHINAWPFATQGVVAFTGFAKRLTSCWWGRILSIPPASLLQQLQIQLLHLESRLHSFIIYIYYLYFYPLGEVDNYSTPIFYFHIKI